MRRVERFLNRRQLFAQRADLFVEDVDLGERARRDLPLRVERAGRGGRLVVRRFDAAAALRRLVEQALTLVLRSLERRREGGDLRLILVLLRALEGEHARQLLDLAIELGERRVLAGHFARQEELREHEHRQQENDHQQHRRQRVDEAGPVIHARQSPSARRRHRIAP